MFALIGMKLFADQAAYAPDSSIYLQDATSDKLRNFARKATPTQRLCPCSVRIRIIGRVDVWKSYNQTNGANTVNFTPLSVFMVVPMIFSLTVFSRCLSL